MIPSPLLMRDVAHDPPVATIRTQRETSFGSALISASIRIALLALVYALSGWLALKLAIPPGYATAIFPPAGIALAAVLRYGYPLLPGVWLGSFGMNLWTSFAHGTDPGGALVVSAMIAAGAMLQTALGTLLIKRFVHRPVALDDVRNILLFFLLGGMIGCLPSASVGVGTLYLTGSIGADEFPYSWFTWWIGDAIGVFIATPLALVLIGEPRAIWKPRALILGIPMVLTLTVVIGVFYRTSGFENERIAQEFSNLVHQSTEGLRSQLQSSLNSVNNIERLYATLGFLDGRHLAIFMDTGVSGSGKIAASWNPRVTASERAAFEASMRQEGHPNFTITELDPDGKLRPAGERADYVPVALIEPLLSNSDAVGFDVSSEPTRAAALTQACDKGRLSVTAPIHPVQRTAGHTAVLLFAPTYQGGRIPETVAERRKQLRGFATALIPAQELGQIVSAGLDPLQVKIRINDVTGGGRLPIFQSASPWPDTSQNALRIAERIGLSDRSWTVDFAGTAEYLSAHRTWHAWVVLAAGLVFTALLGAFLMLVSGHTSRIEHTVSERTRALLQALESLELSEQRFRVFADTAPVMIWMTDAHYRMQMVNQRFLNFTGRALEEELSKEWTGDDIHPQDQEQCLAQYGEHLKNRTPFKLDFRLRNQSGEYRWIEELAVPYFAPDGHYLGHIGACLDVTENKLAAQRIEAALQEKTVLLNEVHHRVKNNLQVVSSLLNLQATHNADPTARVALADSQRRVRVMALVHQLLYEHKDFSRIGMREYLGQLIHLVRSSYLQLCGRIEMDADIENLSIEIQHAIPCGLLVNELLSNVMKHAFPGGRSGKVTVSFKRENGDHGVLRVLDDGIGLPPGFSLDTTRSLGLQLAQSLASQLNGKLVVQSVHGTQFELQFPLPAVT
jgi:PAS domain S-box-containing protein